MNVRLLKANLDSMHRLYQQNDSNPNKAQVNEFEEGVSLETVIQKSAKEYGGNNDHQRNQVIMRDCWHPQPREPIAKDGDNARGQKISLQGGAEVLGSPAPHGAIND